MQKKTTQPIVIKFGRKVAREPRKKPLDFGSKSGSRVGLG